MFYLAFNFSKLPDSEKIAFGLIVFLILLICHLLFISQEKGQEETKKVEEEKRRRELKKELRDERLRQFYESKEGLHDLILKKEAEIKHCEGLMSHVGRNSEAARLRRENMIPVLNKELEELYSKL